MIPLFSLSKKLIEINKPILKTPASSIKPLLRDDAISIN
jgi:hypothetical protein